MGIKAYFIQYRFIIPESVKHSSYTYQKLFRAIYGYTQAVYKSSGKVYHYYRPGVLSGYPFIRPGKNCVIVPQSAFQSLQNFFETGNNPTHKWRVKGDWKCTYFLNEKDVEEKAVISALEELISRRFVEKKDGPSSLFDEMKRAIEKKPEAGSKALLVKGASSIAELDWFVSVYSQSKQLSDFYKTFRDLKSQ
ncbi:MAG: hypothetical protein NTZ73_04780 [Candidatus Diapherotrites archaeon]|nr:hypothetical protein [Candidatus Diapherotrites archaeon]